MRNPATPDCSIKGCTRAACVGLLCRKHYALVPRSLVMEKVMECFDAQMRTASKHNRRQLAYVRGVLSSSRSAEAS